MVVWPRLRAVLWAEITRCGIGGQEVLSYCSLGWVLGRERGWRLTARPKILGKSGWRLTAARTDFSRHSQATERICRVLSVLTYRDTVLALNNSFQCQPVWLLK